MQQKVEVFSKGLGKGIDGITDILVDATISLLSEETLEEIKDNELPIKQSLARVISCLGIRKCDASHKDQRNDSYHEHILIQDGLGKRKLRHIMRQSLISHMTGHCDVIIEFFEPDGGFYLFTGEPDKLVSDLLANKPPFIHSIYYDGPEQLIVVNVDPDAYKWFCRFDEWDKRIGQMSGFIGDILQYNPKPPVSDGIDGEYYKEWERITKLTSSQGIGVKIQEV